MPDESVPTFGWRGYEWRKPAIRCVSCNRKVRRGVININDEPESGPPARVMCWSCYHSLDERVNVPESVEGVDIYGTTDDELPGMWSTSDYTGGKDDLS